METKPMKLVDMHCDTLGVLLRATLEQDSLQTAETQADALPTLLHNSFHIDLEKLQKSHYLLQNFAVFIFLREGENPLEHALHMIDL